MIPAAGATLASGRYRLERRLGVGGMASVWLAVDGRLERPVAVKLLADTLAGDAGWRHRFEREARAAAAVSDPCVVPVLDYGLEDERPYLVMLYVPGGTLAERLADPAAARPDPEIATRQLLGALARVHAAGIIHRDVKAANLLLDDGGNVRLTDFGIAQPEDATALTQTGMVLGTVRYLAPEVLAGAPATVRSDLYSAGIVVRELTGDGGSPALGRLIEALTAPAPEDRPASAHDALALLDRWTGEAAATDGRTGEPEPTALTRRMLLRAPRGRPGPRTRPTRVAPAAQPGVATAASGAAADLARAPRLSAGALVAALAAAAVLVAFVVALAGSTRASSGPPAPAPPRAPLSRQIDGLQRIVDYARSH